MISDERWSCHVISKLASIVCLTSVFGSWSLLFASCMAKLAIKHKTSNICLPTSKKVFDLNQKHFCLPTCKMCLPNMKCLKNLVVAKRESNERLLKLSHVRQTMLVSLVRPLNFRENCQIWCYHCLQNVTYDVLKI